jgi:hypothetical protein
MKPDSIAAVFDRTEIDALRKMAGELEADAPDPHDAGWSKGLTLFEAFENMRYVVFVADSAERIVDCAPRIMLAADDRTLRETLTQANDILAGHTAKWWIKGTDETCGLVRGVLKELTIPALPMLPTPGVFN